MPRDRLCIALNTDESGLSSELAALGVILTGRGLAVQCHADLVQLVTAPDLARGVENFLGSTLPQRLSHAALETLAVIAYRQPATRAQIEAVRGVDSASVVGTLLARGLIEEAGRLPGPGHPVQYATTPDFVRLFGLSSLDELPTLLADDGTTLETVWATRI